LLAFSFHASVFRRFTLMEEGLKTATVIRYAMEWDELAEIEYHSEAYYDNQESLRHLLLAFEYAKAAHVLQENVTKEQQDIVVLEEDAEVETEQATKDQEEASMWALRAFGDGRAFVGAELSGIELGKQAQAENEKGHAALLHANQTLTEGTEKLHQAQAALELAEEAQNHTTLDKGICRWMPLACSVVRSHPDANSTYPANPTDAAIQANKDIQDALEEIHNAKEEREYGLELLANASAHANLSTQILQDANMFRTQANKDRQEANEYRVKEIKEEREYGEDKKMIQEESAQISFDIQKMNNYTNTSRDYLHMAISERREFRESWENFESSRARARDMQILLDEKTIEAKQHVAKAGWSALVACFAGACLLGVVTIQIIAAFRYQRPLQWIVRDPPHTEHDVLFLVNHIFIFFLSIGYVGELLIDFGHETKLARAAIVVLFSVVGAIFQATLLQFVPHMCRMFQASGLDLSISRVLCQEDVLKKGLITSILFALEMLLCWVNIGSIAFTGAYKLNNWWCWISVFLLSACYSVYVVKTNYVNSQFDTSGYLEVFDASPSIVSGGPSKIEHEKRLLLAELSLPESVQQAMGNSITGSLEGSAQGSIMSPDSGSSSPEPPAVKSSSSMSSVPLGDVERTGYGATSNGSHAYMSIIPEIRSSFVSSWSCELGKLQLLFEMVVASWALWIIRTDIILIFKLSPMAKDFAWGRCPLWILNIFFLFILVTVAMSWNKKGESSLSSLSIRSS
jgi:hypothetical protein